MNLEQQYRNHMTTYTNDTAVMSFTVAKHPSFQALRRMGVAIIPLLLTDLQTCVSDTEGRYIGEISVGACFHLLAEFTGESPFAKEDAGRVARIEKAWINWGIKHGYIEAAPESPKEGLWARIKKTVLAF
jgi:hypothetical protein